MNLAKKAIRLNSATQLAVTKMDVLYSQCAGVREYAKLPTEAKKFIENIEGETGLKVVLIGTGPELYDVVDRRS
jgi:adenylosuccinate synthase